VVFIEFSASVRVAWLVAALVLGSVHLVLGSVHWTALSAIILNLVVFVLCFFVVEPFRLVRHGRVVNRRGDQNYPGWGQNLWAGRAHHGKGARLPQPACGVIKHDDYCN